MGRKLLVIDGLPRSGTTLLNTIVNTQDGCASIRGGFHEGLAMGYPWFRGGIMERPHPIDSRVQVAQSLPPRWRDLLFRGGQRTTISWPLLRENTLDVLRKRRQYQHIAEERWRELLARPIRSLAALDALYDEVAAEMDANVLCFRWNKAVSCAGAWLARPDHYWLAVVRDPRSRAVSARRTYPKWTFEKSLETGAVYAERLEYYSGISNFYIVYYEDILSDPEGGFKKIFSWLGVDCPQIQLSNLINTDGKPHRNETSMLVEAGKSHREGIQQNRVSAATTYDYNQIMGEKICRKFQDLIASHAIYEPYSSQ